MRNEHWCGLVRWNAQRGPGRQFKPAQCWYTWEYMWYWRMCGSCTIGQEQPSSHMLLFLLHREQQLKCDFAVWHFILALQNDPIAAKSSTLLFYFSAYQTMMTVTKWLLYTLSSCMMLKQNPFLVNRFKIAAFTRTLMNYWQKWNRNSL